MRQNVTRACEPVDARRAGGEQYLLLMLVSFGGSVILQQNDRWEGTGHNSVVRDEAGRDRIFYHAIDPDDRYNPGTEAPKRPMLIDPIVYRSGWPEIEESSPSTTKRQGPLVR